MKISPSRLSAVVFAAGTVLVATTAVAPTTASAHFVLEDPPASADQDVLGSPQKAPPCGGGADNGILSVFAEGQTLTITVDETVFHPGHYRVALGLNGPGDLPEEPPVTAGSTACGSTVIQDPPVFPVLADGELLHTSAFSGPQSFQVTLPPGVTCDHCTLQVIQFMSNHALNNPGGCFYHHCATVSIGVGEPTSVTTGGPTTTTGSATTSASSTSSSTSSSGAGAGGDAAGTESGGCSVASGAAGGGGALGGLILATALALAGRRKR